MYRKIERYILILCNNIHVFMCLCKLKMYKLKWCSEGGWIGEEGGKILSVFLKKSLHS